MRRSGSVVAAAILILLAVARPAMAEDKEDVLAAAKAWSTALVDGNAKAIRTGSTGTEAELARWEAMSKMFASFQKLTDAVKAKFGDKADMAKMFQRPDFASLGDDPKVAVTGMDATLTTQEGKPPMKLKKEGTAWKVVLSSMPAAAAKLDPKQMTPITDAVTSTAEEIVGGKYPTQEDAMKGLQAKMAKARTKPKE
jgi:hypothetical protein